MQTKFTMFKLIIFLLKKYQEQVLKSLMLLEEFLFVQYNWRLYAEFLHQIIVLPTCYTSDQVFYVGKVMLNRLECVVSNIFYLLCCLYVLPSINFFFFLQRQKPIREAVCTLLLTILRYNLDANQRTLLREHLIDRNYLNTIFLI